MKIITNVNNIGITNISRVLVLFAHPDDETPFSAGLLQKIAKTGAVLHSITLSKGEKSTLAFGTTQDKLAEVREDELKKAAALLGIQQVTICDYADGRITKQEKEIRDYLFQYCQTFQPTTLVTFEPDGISGHPDHIAVSQIVTDIWKSDLQKRHCALWYVTVSEKYIPSAATLSMAKHPEKIRPRTPNVQIRLTLFESFKKIYAFMLHKSQFKTNPSTLIKWHKRELLQNEFLHMTHSI